jgi:hypothetical protein
MYERLGFPELSPYQLDPPHFKPPAETYEEAIHWPNRMLKRFTGSVFLNYDTSVTELGTDRYLDQGFPQRSGVTQNAALITGIQSTPLKRWTYGADARGLFKHYARDELQYLDSVTAAPSVWASWWNTRSTEVKFRYDYAWTARDTGDIHYFNQVHGPQFGWSELWTKELQVDILYSAKWNFYSEYRIPTAIGMTGLEHSATVTVSSHPKGEVFHPFVKYIFDRNKTDDPEFISNSHALEVGVSYLAGESSRVNLSGLYQGSFFTSSSSGREDHLVMMRLQGVLPASEYFSFFSIPY